MLKSWQLANTLLPKNRKSTKKKTADKNHWAHVPKVGESSLVRTNDLWRNICMFWAKKYDLEIFIPSSGSQTTKTERNQAQDENYKKKQQTLQ